MTEDQKHLDIRIFNQLKDTLYEKGEELTYEKWLEERKNDSDYEQVNEAIHNIVKTETEAISKDRDHYKERMEKLESIMDENLEPDSHELFVRMKEYEALKSKTHE